MARVLRYLAANSLWLVGLGLMLASSGIDGAYMARWMTELPGIGGAAGLGYVLNTTSDIGGMVLMYWFGRLQQEPRTSRRYRLSWFLAGAEFVAVGYSWLFGWRQLRIVLLPVEGAATAWVAPLVAGFIPLLLAFVGYAQALLSGRIERDADAQSPQLAQRRTDSSASVPVAPQPAQLPAYARATLAHFAAHPYDSYADAAATLACSPRTVSNHMRIAGDCGVAHRNGDGWRVKLEDQR